MSAATVTLTLPKTGTARVAGLLREIEAGTGAVPEGWTSGAAERLMFAAADFGEAERMAECVLSVLVEHGQGWQSLVVSDGRGRRVYFEAPGNRKGGAA